MALKDLTRHCQKFLQPYGDLILLTCQVSFLYVFCIRSEFVLFQSALQSGALKLAECIRLNCCIGKVLSIMPIPRVMEYLNVILTPSFEEIQKLVNAEPVLLRFELSEFVLETMFLFLGCLRSNKFDYKTENALRFALFAAH